MGKGQIGVGGKSALSKTESPENEEVHDKKTLGVLRLLHLNSLSQGWTHD